MWLAFVKSEEMLTKIPILKIGQLRLGLSRVDPESSWVSLQVGLGDWFGTQPELAELPISARVGQRTQKNS